GEAVGQKLLAATVEGRLAGMARFDVEGEPQVGALWYVAVADELRGGGLGSVFYEEIVRRIRSEFPDCEAMFIEVNDPDRCTEPRDIAERRTAWYGRMGARMLGGI